MQASRLAPRLLQLAAAACGRAAAGCKVQYASLSSAAGAGGGGGGASAAARAGSRQQWAAAVAACLGVGAVGLQMYPGGDNTAECEAAASPPDAPPEGAPAAEAAAPKRKTRVVVLGSGWGAVAFLKNLDWKGAFGPNGQYEVVVVSPRSYFLYTPLLPGAAAGSVQERSIMEPIRNLLAGQGQYYQAACTSIDAERQVLHCAVNKCHVCEALDHESGKCQAGGGGGKKGWMKGGAAAPPAAPAAHELDTFEVPYDILLVGVGSVNNTFGIQGVAERCFFLKSIDDAHRLRVHISKVVEHAGLPHLTREERRRHLNFVVVGGGPTGVELAAELHDFVQEDVARLLPHLKEDISITVVDTMDHLLGAFDRQLSEYTASHFMREGINVQLGTMVRSVGEGALTVTRNGNKTEEKLPFGTCVWATGIAMHPLVRGLKEQLQRQLEDVQNSRTGVVVDGHLRVKGTNGTIFAMGDAAVTHQDKSVEDAAKLFAEADTNKDNRLSRDEVTGLLKKAGKRYPQMGELAAMLEEGVLEKAARGVWGASRKEGRYSKHVERLEAGLSFEEFQELLTDMDTLMRSLPPTAQVLPPLWHLCIRGHGPRRALPALRLPLQRPPGLAGGPDLARLRDVGPGVCPQPLDGSERLGAHEAVRAQHHRGLSRASRRQHHRQQQQQHQLA
ncbi:hypothetical protein CHLNCDRAFT_58189 [Chlorella variabilis]|uniref:NADH:ubiquinone reductase (non-electrogenic) n=1 Tax=Chlorella variabilis TaxID=554065 RepID=E1ZI09_CHLVA|nr:hypothetical protein CHLNCDRAFT_58189 [Chlorella variabilis]EFN54551.1 hypothetical protein CHLNCDRAFT_58189 [Chlorella variabilis]|eukprot:XP_005846653.1 hypothetical protein CHLNCDRAFT_58189 [Chlorella variabilis]